MSGVRGALGREFRQSWVMVLVVAIVSCLFGATAGVGYINLRYQGITGTPDEVVLRYLQALARNDAVSALAQVEDAPTGSLFLTDEVLRNAHADHPMKEIKVDVTRSHRVPVSYRLGDELISTAITVTLVDREYKVKQGFAKVNLAATRAAAIPIQLGGRTVAADEIDVFPGTYPLTSGDRRVVLSPTDPVKAGHVGQEVSPGQRNVELSEGGHTMLNETVDRELTLCARQSVAAPQGCPFQTPSPSSLTPNSVRWKITDGPKVDSRVVEDSHIEFTATASLEYQATLAKNGAGISETVRMTQKKGRVNLLDETWTVRWD